MNQIVTQNKKYRNFGGEAFLENNEEFYQWANKSENDIYLQGNSYRYQMNNSSTEWNNATGQYGEHQGYMNAGGDPSINVGGETFDMQPTLAWNQGDFFRSASRFWFITYSLRSVSSRISRRQTILWRNWML